MARPAPIVDPLDRPWVGLVRAGSNVLLVTALVTMIVSLIIVVTTPNEAGTLTITLFGEPAPAHETRLSRQPLAWAPVISLVVGGVALAARAFADRKYMEIRLARAKLGIFPPPQPSPP